MYLRVIGIIKFPFMLRLLFFLLLPITIQAQTADTKPIKLPPLCYCLPVPQPYMGTVRYAIYTGPTEVLPEGIEKRAVFTSLEEDAEPYTFYEVMDTERVSTFEYQELEVMMLDQQVEAKAIEIICAKDISRKLTKSVQQSLTEAGYYDGELKGKYDEATKAALRSFQEDNGLFPGPLTVQAIAALGIAVKKF